MELSSFIKENRENEDRLIQLLESAYPKWQHKEELNQGILSHFEWGCQSNSKLKNVIEN